MSEKMRQVANGPVLRVASKTGWDRGKSVAADRAERVVMAARRAAELLDQISCHGPANDVRRVCRSNKAYRTTLRQLYLDNMELRKEIAELKARAADAFDEGRAVGYDEGTDG